jgi:endonuclease YncB( thermonuclease family)
MFGLFSREKAFGNANDIPSEYFKDKKEIKAIVVKITDGDTFRVRHVSRSRPNAEFEGNLKDHTIAIRIAAVDAPETAKFGEEGQKHGEIAKNFVSERLMGKRVTIKLLARDQYSRVLGLVTYRDNTILPNFLCSKKDISEQLLIHGLAAVYRQGGAQYDGSIDRWNALEQKAIRAKRGIWMNGEKSADLPSAYKKITKEKTHTKSREFTKV